MRARFLALLLVLPACGRTSLYDYPTEQGLGEDPDRPGCVVTESDSYTLPPMSRRPVDVLFVIDDSASMRNDQQALASNFQSFIRSFLAHEVDFHLGAVTTDMRASNRKGRLVSSFLTPKTPDLEGAFRRMVNVGVSGSPTEKGIDAAHAALTEPLRSSANKDFLRDKADFSLVFLSDEDDQSTLKWQDFVSFLRGLKPDAAGLTVASIVGLQGGLFCDWSVANWGYVKVAEAFGPRGLVVKCNSNYAKTMEQVGGGIIHSRCIIGLRRPIDFDRPIRVLVNGGRADFEHRPGDLAYPHGSIEVVPCPVEGGTVEILYENCR